MTSEKDVADGIPEDIPVEIDVTDGFPEEIIYEFKEAFTFFDKELRGNIPTALLGTVMRALGQNPTEKELQDTISEVDKENLGTIDFDKFISLMKCKLWNSDMEEELREAFRTFDRENTGVIHVQLLHNILTSKGDVFEESEFEEMMREITVTDNDEITYDPFVSLVMSK